MLRKTNGVATASGILLLMNRSAILLAVLVAGCGSGFTAESGSRTGEAGAGTGSSGAGGASAGTGGTAAGAAGASGGATAGGANSGATGGTTGGTGGTTGGTGGTTGGTGGTGGTGSECTPLSILEACVDAFCGTASDGCTGTHNCGSCSGGQICKGGDCCVHWGDYDSVCNAIRPYYFTCGANPSPPEPSCIYYGAHVATGTGSAFCCSTVAPE